MRKSPKFSPEVVERAVRMVFDAKDQYPPQWAAIESIAGKIGRTGETLRRWVRQGERDSDVPAGSTAAEQQRIKELEREVGARAAQDQRDPEAGQRVFCPGGARPPSQEVNAFIDEHHARLGVEPICRALQVAPSAYHRDAARQPTPNGCPGVPGVMPSYCPRCGVARRCAPPCPKPRRRARWTG